MGDDTYTEDVDLSGDISQECRDNNHDECPYDCKTFYCDCGCHQPAEDNDVE